MHAAWIAVAVPFSYWRSGSFELWRNSLKVIVFFYAIQILLSDWAKLALGDPGAGGWIADGGAAKHFDGRLLQRPAEAAGGNAFGP
jgi:hypothetical protein